jgi:cytochrome P450
VFTSPDLRGGASSGILAPFAGPSSILLLDGEEHLVHRRRMLPAFHGPELERHRPAIREVAEREVASWAPGMPLRALPRMRSLTLDVILRVVFGSAPEPRVRAAVEHGLELTHSLPKLARYTILGRRADFTAAVEEVDAALYHAIARARREGADGMLATLLDAPDNEVRDMVVTLLAAGHETTATALAWALERLSRHPDALERIRAGDGAYLDATVKEVLRVRPVLSIAARQVVEPYQLFQYTLPPGTHVAACMYLAHRTAGPDFRPERWLDGDPPQWLPFGGGVRRCLGAAVATMEMREVLAAVAGSHRLRPARGRPERMVRRSVTLAPSAGGHVVVS